MVHAHTHGFSYIGLICVLIFMGARPAYSQSIVLNEVMASNGHAFADPQGDYDDWIELFNNSNQIVDVSGYWLSDDPDNPKKWSIPNNISTLTTLEPGGFLVIWADDDTGDLGLHANFKLSALGEDIVLSDPNGMELDHLRFGEQTQDISYGRFPDGTDNWSFLDSTTPGAVNVGTFAGFVEDVRFSHARNFYEEPFTLSLFCPTEGAQIYYSLNTSDPLAKGARGGYLGQLYNGPIEINHTTVVRAVAIKSGWRQTPILSQSYIFLEDVLTQSNRPEGFPTSWGGQTADYGMDPRVVDNAAYHDEMIDDLRSIPSVSLVLSNEDLFGNRGIYSHPTSTGVAWERPVTMEWIDPNTGKTFGVNAGIRINGGQYGRARNVKKALRVLFKSEYGPSQLEYPIFEDTEVQVFNTLVLRSIWNYSWTGEDSDPYRATYLRDVFARDTIRDLGRLNPYGRPVHVYLNGLYWGLYIMTERPDDSFAAAHLGGNREDYDVVKASNTGTAIETVAGNQDTWNQMFDMAYSGLADDASYQQMQAILNIPDMIDYMLMIYYTGSRDAPVLLGNDNNPRNFYAICPKAAQGQYLFLPWDVEWSLEDLYQDRLWVVGQLNPHVLVDRLMHNEDFRLLLADRIYKQFYHDGPLTDQQCTARYMKRADEIRGAIVCESARWGDTLWSYYGHLFTREDWQNEVDWLVYAFFAQRSDVVMDQFRSYGMYPTVEPPSFAINDVEKDHGLVERGDLLSLSNPNGKGRIYFTFDGSDPRDVKNTAEPNEDVLLDQSTPRWVKIPDDQTDDQWNQQLDYDTAGWTETTGAVGFDFYFNYRDDLSLDLEEPMWLVNSSCLIRIPFEFDSQTVQEGELILKMRCDDGFVAYLNGVRVAGDHAPEELSWNAQASDQRDGTDWISYFITDNAQLLHDGTNLLAIQGLNVRAADTDFFVDVKLVIGSGDLPQTGIYNGPMRINQTLRLKSRILSQGQWSALHESVFMVDDLADSLRISELMYHPHYANDGLGREFVELTNISDSPINLNWVSFTRGIQFTFGNWELEPNQVVLVVQDANAWRGSGLEPLIAGQYQGQLANNGERLILVDGTGKEVLNFKYQDAWYDLSDGQGFSLVLRDLNTPIEALSDKASWRPSPFVGGSPGTDDRASGVPSPDDVVINELLANSPDTGSDWVELYNTTDRIIDLSGWWLSDDANDPAKFIIADNTLLPAQGYMVFYQSVHFGNNNNPGTQTPFGLSASGETFYVQAATQGEPLGFSTQESFGATLEGTVLGRITKSTGGTNFVALRQGTPGGPNADPVVGPIVINEIMYHPLLDPAAEYVELLNISSQPVTLYSYAALLPWGFSDDGDRSDNVEFLFPTDTPITMEPGEYLLLAEDPGAVQATYQVPVGVSILDWGEGRLSNAASRLQISQPAGVRDGEIQWVRVDRVSYDDGSDATDDWPDQADGRGLALSKIDPSDYGNDVAVWTAAEPSPGRANP